MQKTTIRIYFPHQLGEIGLQQRATLVVNTPSLSTIPTGVKVSGLDLHGEELILCAKLKKDHDCVTKTLHEELFPGGAKVDVTFYCKGSNSGGCKTKKPARVCLSITLIYEEGLIKVISSPFTVKGNRRQKIKRLCNSSRRENLAVTTVIDNPPFLMENNSLVPARTVPTVLPSLVKTEPRMVIKTERNGSLPPVSPPIKQEPCTNLSSSQNPPFIDKYRLIYSIQTKRPKTEDTLPPPHGQPYYLDSRGSIHMENIQAQYYPPPSTNAIIYQKGPYTPNDYSIPPDEEGDNGYNENTDLEYHYPLVKMEPFNRPGIDKHYNMFEGVNSMEYYYSQIDPREEGRYGYNKRRCLEGNVFKNL
jgi:hypothetical protein